MRLLPVVLAALIAAACGPTAIGIATPTPGLGTLPAATPSRPGSTGPTPVGGGSIRVLDDFPAADAFEIYDVTETPTGFMAVGYGGLDGEDYYGRHQGIIWTSTDGVAWSESVDPSLANVTPMRVVVRDSDYFLLGVLATCPEFSEEECTEPPEAGFALWQSSDGRSWQLLAQQADIRDGLVDEMVVAGDRLVLFGAAGDADQSTTAWQSFDGQAWTKSVDLAGMEIVTAMTFGQNQLVAFGTRYAPVREEDVIIAGYSADGTLFTAGELPSLPGAAIDDVVQGANGFVGVGYRSTELLELSGVAVKSADGVTWTEASNVDDSWASGGLQTVDALGSGYVSVGFRPHADDFTLQDVGIWLSPDGSDWYGAAALPGAVSTLSAAALGQTGLVVFGVEQSEDVDGNVSSLIHAWFAPLGSLGQ